MTNLAGIGESVTEIVDAQVQPQGIGMLAPERTWPAPRDHYSARDFLDRELGLLAEQGGLDRARVMLAQRTAATPDDAEVYLDAIRFERTVSATGTAWQSWLLRGLEQGAPIVEKALELVPHDQLAAYLASTEELSWGVLGKQRARFAARELWRLRVEAQLRSEPMRALESVEEPELLAACASDVVLRRYAVAVALALAWQAPGRARVIAERCKQAGEDDALAPAITQVEETAQLARSVPDVWRTTAVPAPLARAIELLPVLEGAHADELITALARDLRVRSEDYVASARAVTASSDALAEGLRVRLLELTRKRALRAAASAHTTRDAAEARAIEDAVRADRSRHAPLAALIASLLGALLAFFWAGIAGIGFASAGALVAFGLRDVIHARLYRAHVQPLLLRVMVAHGLSLRAAVEHCSTSSAPRLVRRLLRRADDDPSLALLGAVAALAGTPPSS